MSENTAVTTQPDELTLARKWESQYDPLTTRIITDLAVPPTARCLDVAAGAGSMSYWLAEHVRDGSVLAVDLDTRYLDATRAANLTVRQLDVSGAEFDPGSFDLILARGAFSSQSRPDELLDRATRWLAPGGWLVAEDFYFLPGEDSPTPAGRAVVGAYTKAFEMRGANVRWARRLPARLAQLGLTRVDMHVRCLGPGLSVGESELIRMRLELQGHQLVDNGLVSAEQIAEFIEGLNHPEARDVTTLQFSVWGQRAAS